MLDTVVIPANDNGMRPPALVSVNKVTLCGWIHEGPEWRVTQAGRKVIHCLLANEGLASHQSMDVLSRPSALLHIVIDEHLSSIAGFRLTQGQRLMVEGQLQTRHSTDEAGKPVILTEIVLAGRHARLALLDEPETPSSS